ncbi:MAG: hypothetical protein LBE36_13565 [Flavobacteriaceae bacterium]|nr:hypothetical protein [Flavobacteriaceae bacterium]
MEIFKNILWCYLQMFYRWAGIYPDEFLPVIKQREAQCKGCPLRKGGWCSSKRYVTIDSYPDKSVFKDYEAGIIDGCGCWIKAKVYTQLKNQCPLKKWDEFSSPNPSKGGE